MLRIKTVAPSTYASQAGIDVLPGKMAHTDQLTTTFAQMIDKAQRGQHHDTIEGQTVGISSSMCQHDGTKQERHPKSPEQATTALSEDNHSAFRQNNQERRPEEEARHCNHLINVTSSNHDTVIGKAHHPPRKADWAIRDGEMKKLVRVLHKSRVSGRRKVALTLNLQELGDVKLNVTIWQQNVSIEAIVQNRRAAGALHGAVSQLQCELEKIDMRLERFDVAVERAVTSNTGSIGTGATWLGGMAGHG